MFRVFGVLLAVLLAIVPDHAYAMGSARELARDCRTLLQGKRGSGKEIQIPFTRRALVCWGYMQAIQDFSVLADPEGRRVLGACPREKTTLLELIEAFVAYARSHARDLPENAALAVTQALQEAFPCSEPSKPRGRT